MKEQGAESQNRSSGLLAEIGGRRGAEEALRASEQRLQDVLDHTTAVIFVKDLELRYILVNREYERISTFILAMSPKLCGPMIER